MKNYNKLKRREGKNALGKHIQALRNLFLIGVFLLGLGDWCAFAQSITSEIPSGLVMSKRWDPTSDDGTKGNVILETYVTGSSITSISSVPNDIVLVVDQSGSMADPLGDDTRLQALKDAVTLFCTMVKDDAVANDVDHKIAIVGFASGYSYQTTSGWSYVTRWDWTNTELLSTQNEVAYGTNMSGNCQLEVDDYQDALVSANVNGNINSRLSTAVTRLSASGGTCMQYGLEMAYGVLSNRETTTYTAPDGTTKDRGQIVIFFTDGYAGLSSSYTAENQSATMFSQYGDGESTFNVTIGTGWNQQSMPVRLWSQTIADAAVTQANNLKNHGATVFSVGVFGGADPTMKYQTTHKTTSNFYVSYTTNYGTNYVHVTNRQINYWEPSTLPSGQASGDAAANGLMHMISSNYDGTVADLPTSWTSETTSADNVANRFVEHDITDPETGETYTWKPKYFAAGSESELNAIFTSLASQSGAQPMEMSAATVVQDQVSANFTLPEGTNASDIKVWAPLCTYAEFDNQGNVVNFQFDDLSDDGTLTLDANGVVDGGTENRLPSSVVKFVNYDQNGNLVVDGNGNPVYFSTPTKYMRITGFNFSEMYCGLEGQQGQEQPRGRKLVISVPLEVEEGVWGDGIETNGPLTFVLPDGSEVAYAFERPITNVLGDVWTEVVTTKPTSFPDIDDLDEDDFIEIGTPEELAWFISEVNGRVFYNENNTVASHTGLNGKLTADIDMSAHNWVPIGAGYKCNDQNQFVDANGHPAYLYDEQGNHVVDANGNWVTKPTVKLAYEGTFDGNGHVITGLKNNADKVFKTAAGQENQMVVFPGMFSNIGPEGVVHDVFILDADFRGKHHNEHFIHHGILADTLTGGQIYNCEAAGRLTCNNDKTTDINLIYGGLVGLNRDGGTIHSSMAMATLTAYTLGGGVGENRTGSSFKNSFTNGVYNYLDEAGSLLKPIGGLVGINSGTVDNCYVRFERYNSNLDKATFGMVYGSNSGTFTNCYTPELTTFSRPSAQAVTVQVETNTTVPNNGEMNPYTITVSPTYYYYFTNDNMTKGSWGTESGANVYSGTSLLTELNNVVSTLNEELEEGEVPYSEWKRTTAGNYDYAYGSGDINDDFPVLQLDGYTCLASTDGITIDYGHTLDEILDRHNTGALNVNTTLPDEESGISETMSSSHDYHVNQTVNKTQSDFIYGATINLYVNDNTSRSTSTEAGTMVYIDENISLLQNASSQIDAYTGQTVKSYEYEDEENPKERWHLVSSSLSNSKFGWHYGTEEQVEHSQDPNPCNFGLNESNEDQAFFPIDLRNYRRVDFYSFYEKWYHWINFKRNSLSHWHMDLIDDDVDYHEPTNHEWIDYVNELGEHANEEYFIPGKGYLMSIDMMYGNDENHPKTDQFLQNRGILNNGPINMPVTFTDDIEWSGRQGYNLIGNPYQSYLDFDAFVTGNSALMSNSAFQNTYSIYVPEQDAWIQYKKGSSEGANTADRFINMHQGFFIQVLAGGNATFTNDMRFHTAGNHGFRGEQYNYPLVNFTLTDSNGDKDIAVLEVGRPENDGAKKIFVSTSNGRLYLRHDNEDFAILFRDLTSGKQPLYFDAKEDGTFTLSWNTANANFSSLILVDNITGVSTDMLANDSYTFYGSTDDYNSRFKVIFGNFYENEDDDDSDIESFAFFDGSEWIVKGQGTLTVTDMMGRIVYCTTLNNQQNSVNLNGLSQGVYLMRIANNNNAMVQKIVVR